MTLYLDMCVEIRRRRTAAAGNKFALWESIYEGSPLLSRLASEAGHEPMTPDQFTRSLKRLEEEALARRAELHRLRRRREELEELADAQERFLLGATPHTPVDEVITARQRLEAAMFLLSLMPEGEGEDAGDEVGEAGRRQSLERWHERLKSERSRIIRDCLDLDRNGEGGDLGTPGSRAALLMEELAAVEEALEDVKGCMEVPTSGRRPAEYLRPKSDRSTYARRQ